MFVNELRRVFIGYELDSFDYLLILTQRFQIISFYKKDLSLNDYLKSWIEF